jgi:hypothetical protein
VLLATVSFATWGQRQVLKDASIATSAGEIFAVEFGAASPDDLIRQNPGENPTLTAIAFAPPAIAGAATRDLLAVVDNRIIVRYLNGGTAAGAPEQVLDVNSLRGRNVNTIAVDPSGNIWVDYKPRGKPERLLIIAPDGAVLADPAAVGIPVLSDTVYLDASNVDGLVGPLGGDPDGGLLGASKSGIWFFPAGDPAAFVQVISASDLGLKGKTQIQSVDLAGDFLLVATSDRQVLSIGVNGGPVYTFADLSATPDATCTSDRNQTLRVRTTSSGDTSVAVITDAACGFVQRFNYTDPTAEDPEGYGPAESINSDPSKPIALAVGEGSVVDLSDCKPGDPCDLTAGAEAELENPQGKALVLEFPELCDSRVPKDDGIAVCRPADPATILPGNELDFNALLPPALQAALAAAGVQITVPDYMFGAGPNGLFGALVINTDAITGIVNGTAYVEALVGFTLGCDPVAPRTLPRGTSVGQLIDNDVVGYARTGGGRPTAGGGYEVQPVTVGCGSSLWRIPGFSAVLYGLQHDGTAPGGRELNGGLPGAGATAFTGSPPQCPLVRGTASFTPYTASAGYFLNLVACLFADLQELVTTVMPDSAFGAGATDERAALAGRLDNASDKLIKSLNACDPTTTSSCGSENFGSFLSQMVNFETELLDPTVVIFDDVVYRDELLVRSEVIRFNTESRTVPSLP